MSVYQGLFFNTLTCKTPSTHFFENSIRILCSHVLSSSLEFHVNIEEL